jgi:hypothetical protein
MEPRRYSAQDDAFVLIVTNIVLMACVMVVFLKPLDPSPDQHLRFSILFFFLPIQFLIWLLHPIYYSITDDTINIKRPLATLQIPFENILEVRTIEWREMGFTYRLMASGGIFGYLGIYSSSVYGRIILWCTNRDHLVMITCKDKIIVISPSEPLAFVMDYNSRYNSAT